jgi:hypothetical protein
MKNVSKAKCPEGLLVEVRLQIFLKLVHFPKYVACWVFRKIIFQKTNW